jgi:hypothetical protein
MGNSHLEAVEAGLISRYPVAKIPRTPQMKLRRAGSPRFNI